MKPTWQADREYIVAKYHQKEYDPSTGMANADIRKALEEMYHATRGQEHARIKAKAFDFVLSNTRIDISEHDWFVGVSEWNEKSIDRAFCSRWYAEARAKCAPVISEMNDLHNRIKSHLLYLDYCHSVPDWDAVLKYGFSGLKERAKEYRAVREGAKPKEQFIDKTQFYAAKAPEGQTLTEEQRAYFDTIDEEYDSILRFLARARDIAYAKHNAKCDKIGDCLEHLRTGAPQTTYECLQIIWLYFVISEYIDCLQVRSFGNLDRLLYPYYVRDLQNGYTEEDIRDIVAAFLMQASSMDYYFGHPLYFGGTKANGESEINPMSYLILDVYDKLGIFDPKLQIKVNRNTPQAFIDKALTMIRGGHNSINFVCEPAMMRSMMKDGYTEEEARNCVITGCYEYCARGDAVGTANVHVNLPKCVELALHDGYDFFSKIQSGPHTGKAEDFKTFEQFYNAFMEQAIAIYERGFAIVAAYESHVGEVNPVPMFSATIKTSLERAFDAYAGGTKYAGSGVLLCSPATAADSLAMVKKYVYEKRELTLSELRDILDQNWEGAEKLRIRILNDPDKWGNNRDLPDALFKDFTETLAKRNNGRLNSRCGRSSTSLHNAKQFLEMGWKTSATPDGRKSGEECSKNATAVHGMNRSGATGAIASISKLDSSLFMGDFPLDIALNPGAVRGEEGLIAMRGLLMSYMENYGHAIHFNVFSPETLRDASEHPDRYKDLQIRVCGWNVLWNSLSPDEQKFYIRQAEAAAQ